MTDKQPKHSATVQEVFVSAITSSLSSSSPKGDPNSSPKIPFDDDDLSVTPFSLQILTQNFKKISSRVGIIFQARDKLVSIFQWENPHKTLSFLCIYTLICINPSLVLMIPSAVFIFGLFLPSYEARYPNSYSDIFSLNNKDIIASKRSDSNGKSSELKDFTANVRNIQNSMSEYTDFYDLINGFLLKYTSFNDDKLSSAAFLFCIIVSVFLILFSQWMPLRLIFLLFGWISVLSVNTDVQKAIKALIEEYKKKRLQLRSRLFLNYDYIYDWIDYNYIAPEIQKKATFVEIFEFELKTDQKNEKLIYYSPNPYAVPRNKTCTPAEEGLRELLYDDSSITGSINCIYPPEGYKFEKNSSWKVDENNTEKLPISLNHKDWSRRKLKREDIPVRSTQEVTRFLRNKSEILENKLRIAKDLLNGDINIYFPQKENFLLSWVLDSLKEIISNEQNSLKVVTELWEFLRNLLKSQDLLPESKYFNFQKHSFTTLLSLTLSFAAKIKEKELLLLISSIVKTIDYIFSEGILSLFIKGSFDTTTTILAGFFSCIKDLNLYDDTISVLGSQIFEIWEKSIYGIENFKKISKTISFKVLPHACYLIGKKDTPTWLDDLFSTVLYKTLFSPELLIDYMNDQTQNVKSRNITLKESSLELFFNSLLNNSPKTYHFRNIDILSSLPKFLQMAQNSLSYNSAYSKVKINMNPSKIMHLNDIFLSEILKLVFKLSPEQKAFKYSIILNILEVSKDNSISHKVSNIILEQQISEIFKESFLLIKDNTMMIGWKLLYTLLKFNFELILPYNEQLWLCLTQIDMESEYSEICYELIKLSVNNYKIQRNLHEFINNWMKFLNFSLINNCILLSDEILIIVMESANTLPLNKIKTIINYILEENNYEILKKSVNSNELSLKSSSDISGNQVKSPFFTFYPLLSILHGLTDTEIISDICKDMVELYKSIIIKVFSDISTFLDDCGVDLIFRIHYKTMMLSHEYVSSTDPYKNLQYIRYMANFKRISPKISFYMIQCQLFYLQYFDQDYSEDFKTENLLLLMDSILDHITFFLMSTSINSLWKAGKMQLINKDNISIAHIYAINNNWLYLINKLCSFDRIKKFMDIFIKFSVESSQEVNINHLLSFSNLWYIFLSNAEIYELGLLRDECLSAFTDYIFSYEFDQMSFQNSIKSYSKKKHKGFIEYNKDDSDILKFRKIIKYLQIIPLNCIKDSVKEKLLDFLFYMDFQFIKRYPMNIVLNESRNLLYRIMVAINTVNSMLYNVFSSVYFCVSLDNINVKEESLISISNSISKEIIRKKILSDKSLADKLIKIIKKYEINLLNHYYTFLQQTENTFYIPGIIQLVSIIFFEIQNNDKIDKNELLREDITKLIYFYFKTIKKCLKKLLEICQKGTSNLEKALNSIFLFQLFFKLSFFFEYDKDSLKQLIFFMSASCFYYENTNIYLYKRSQDLLLSLLKIHCNKIKSHDEILEISIVLITNFKNIQLSLTDTSKISTYYNFESLSIYCFIQQKSQTLNFQDFERISKALCFSSWKVENINMVANILCAILLSRIEEEDELKKKYLELFQTFVSYLILIAKRTKDLEILYNFINLFNILLYKRLLYFSLENLDQLFVLITMTLSSSSPILNLSPNITIDDICKRFCRMISLILKKNHKKLYGRYHLLTNCFQSLLYLFAYDNTNTKITKNSFFHRIPNWISGSSCSVSSAKIYSDSLLCWIKVSHSNKSSKKLKLNSFKTSEKAIAKYLLWIIIEYIKLLLNYSINNEIKVILTSSIMEIFKLLSTHELRMINNALDSQGKTIFKKLYNNYTQYDKWDET